MCHQWDWNQPGHPSSLISLHCSHEETLHPWLSKMHPGKILIRLFKCAGWSESLLGAHCGSYLPYTPLAYVIEKWAKCLFYILLNKDRKRRSFPIWGLIFAEQIKCSAISDSLEARLPLLLTPQRDCLRHCAVMIILWNRFYASYHCLNLKFFIRTTDLPQVFRQKGLGKQCRPRSDAIECGIWSGSTPFATQLVVFSLIDSQQVV